MDIDVAAIHIKIDPVKHKRLAKTQNGLPQEHINGISSVALKHWSHDRVPKHQRDKGIGPFNTMLNIDGWKELEDPREILDNGFVMNSRTAVLVNPSEYALAAHIQGDGNPDESQTRRHLNMNTSDPQGCWHNYVESLAEHNTSHHWQEVPSVQEVEDTSETSSDIERYQHSVGIVLARIKCICHIGREPKKSDG
jgi:hypothetical protein